MFFFRKSCMDVGEVKYCRPILVTGNIPLSSISLVLVLPTPSICEISSTEYNICPDGWEVPDAGAWMDMANTLSGNKFTDAIAPFEGIAGKMMVDATRLDYLTVIKTGEEYSLIYHATSTDMNNVRLVFDGEEMAAQTEKSGSLENYRFDKLTYGQLSGEIAVRVYVATMMKRDTNFTLTLDLAQAVLVPEGTPAKEV